MYLRSLMKSSFMIAIIVLNVSCDRISKSIVRVNIPENATTNYFNNHLIITRVENPGAFLSVGAAFSQNTRLIIFTLLPVLALCMALVYAFKSQQSNKLNLFAISCIIGGGIGNVFDRIVYGTVTDFLYLDFSIFHTGIFNLADVSLTLGVLLLFSRSLKTAKASKI